MVVVDATHKTNALQEPISSGSHIRLSLAQLQPLAKHILKLQVRREGRWVDASRYAGLDQLGDIRTDEIVPRAWGVEGECVAVLREPETRAVVMRRRVPVAGSLSYSYDATTTAPCVLEFHEASDSGTGLGPRIGPTLRWTPAPLRGRAGRSEATQDGLAYSVRDRVTLAPRILERAGHGALITEGYVGAWSNGEPVVEAMDFVLGRQEMLYQPRAEPVEAHDERVIYLGRPHSSWGHFLTQGLARVWYALRNPNLPVVWDNPRPLPDHQQHVLDMLGLQNRQVFLAAPTQWREVVFPHPGVCIGDYVHPAFTSSIGCFPSSSTVPGKRLFLSRSGTSNFPGGAEAELDFLVQRHGFEIYRPERHSIEDQLKDISSAEVVLAVEGSSLHTPLLLRDPVQTKFWALSRHRRGSGLFEHVRRAKGLQYQTLNFLRSRARRARDPIDIDLDALDVALAATDGLTRDGAILDSRRESPWGGQTTYEAHASNTQVAMPPLVETLTAARLALLRGDHEHAAKLLHSA